MIIKNIEALGKAIDDKAMLEWMCDDEWMLFNNKWSFENLITAVEEGRIRTKPRVIWLNIYKDYTTSWNTEETAKDGADHETAKRVAVRIEIPEEQS